MALDEKEFSEIVFGTEVEPLMMELPMLNDRYIKEGLEKL